MNNNTLSIAFKGQLYETDASSANYVFPQGNSDWAAIGESDPRTALTQLNINGNFPCYSIFFTESSVIYAFRKTLSGRANSNCVMVMLRAGGPTKDGKQLVELLQELLTYARSQTSFDQVNKTVLEEKLKTCKELIDWQKEPNAETNEPAKIKDGYRVYKNDNELYEILEKPYQPAYKGYRCIHIVPADAGAKVEYNVNQNEKVLDHISSPIETIYYIKLPQGVVEEDGKKYVSKNEEFNLIYKRGGYDDKKIGKQRVSQSSNYFEISGNTINVYGAEKIGIKFERDISISVKDDKLGNSIKEWEYRINNEKEVSYHDDLKLPDGEYTISISAKGYNPFSDKLDTRKRKDFSFKLTSKNFEEKIYLKPAWPKKKIISKDFKEEPVLLSYSANTSLYKKYKKALDPDNKKNTPPTFYVTQKRPKPIIIMLCIISLLVVFVLGVGAGKWKWDKKNPNTSSEEVGSAIENNLSEKKEDNKMNKEEDDDIAYLNSNNTWKLAELKSEKYKNFFKNGVANGQNFSEFFKENDYPEIKNQKWKKIYSEHIHRHIIAEKNNGIFVDSNRIAYWDMIQKTDGQNKIQSTEKIDLDEALKQKTKTKKATQPIEDNPTGARNTSSK